VTIMAAEAAPAIAEGVTSAGEGATARGAAAGGAASQPRQRQQKPRKSAADRIPRGKIARTNYQPVILVEFVACILLTAATPIATRKNEQGLSPYAGKDIVKLSAITIVYLILAAVSVGGRGPGRVAAWFGGLILLADGLYEASNIVRDLRVFSGAGAAAPAPAPAPGGILPTPAGTQPVLGEVPGG
jgi:hypothetical protein